MSWRKVPRVKDSLNNLYTHNTHNTHNTSKSSVPGNSAYCAYCAYRDEIVKCRDNLIANHKVTNDSVQSELIKEQDQLLNYHRTRKSNPGMADTH